METIKGFAELGELPKEIESKLQWLDEGDGIEATLKRHNACWHHKCKQKLLHVTKLDRLHKSDMSDTNTVVTNTDNDHPLSSYSEPESAPKVPRMTRSMICKPAGPSDSVCIFCDQSDSSRPLHEAMSLNIDQKVRKSAGLIGDCMLLAKLSKGDNEVH